MNLIEELKNYCDINNPVGALMLSGEWGCGKTYLIKTKFIPSVKDTYVFVCISLFGIDSLDKLRVEVKKKWLEKASEFDSLNGTKVSRVADSCRRIFDTIKDRLPENWQKKGEVVSSIMDLINFMPISNRMFEKKVILVFDDLEMELSNLTASNDILFTFEALKDKDDSLIKKIDEEMLLCMLCGFNKLLEDSLLNGKYWGNPVRIFNYSKERILELQEKILNSIRLTKLRQLTVNDYFNLIRAFV